MIYLTDSFASDLIKNIRSKEEGLSILESQIERWKQSLAPEDLYWSETRRGRYGLAFHRRLLEAESLRLQIKEARADLYKSAAETIGDCLLTGCVFLAEDEADQEAVREAAINMLSLDPEIRECIKMAATGHVTEALEKVLMSNAYKEIFFGQYGKYWLKKISKNPQGEYITPLVPGAIWNDCAKVWQWPQAKGCAKFMRGLPPVAEKNAAKIDAA